MSANKDSADQTTIIRLVIDSKTGELQHEADMKIDPAVEMRAREYLTNQATWIPIGDKHAVFDHARRLALIGVPDKWAFDMLLFICQQHWYGAEKRETIARTVKAAYVIESKLGNKYIGRPDLTPTPCDWLDSTKIPPRSWLYRPIYIRKFVSLNSATGGTGKTSLGLVENAAMVTGKPLLGVEPGEEDLRCWYWNGEDPDDEMKRRWAGVIRHYKLTQQELDGRFFLDSGRDMPIKIAALEDGKSVVSQPVVDELVSAIRHHRIDVLNIDPFVSCHSVTENDTAAIQGVAETWAHIANETGCAVALWHHTRKTMGAAATIEDSRGASALAAAARGRRVLNKMTSEEAKSANLDPDERGFYFWADSNTTSMAPPAESRQWFRLESVNLGNGEVGDGDTVGVTTAWEHPGNGPPVLTDEQDAAAFTAIGQRDQWRSDWRAKEWIGYPIGTAIGLDPKAHRKQIIALIEEWTRQGNLEIFRERDENRMEREFIRAAVADVHQSASVD